MITVAYSRSERTEILAALRAVSIHYSQHFPIAFVRATIFQDTVAASLRGLTWARDRWVERRDSYSATWRHFEANPLVMGAQGPEMIQRFQKLQDEADAEVRRINVIGRKVKAFDQLFEIAPSDLPGHPDFHWHRLPRPLAPRTN